MKVLTYDIETLKEYFLIVILIPGQKYRSFEVSKNVNSLAHFISFVEEHKDYYWVGYNNLRFDSQVVEWIIRNHEEWEELTRMEITHKIHQKAQDVIDDANYDVFPEYREYELSVKQIDLFRIHHFDNKNRRVSLKRLEFEMDLPNIEEMPIKHDAVGMTDEDLSITKEYCINDVYATYQFYLITIGQTEHPLYKGSNMIELRQDIQEEFKIPCLNYSDSKIGDEIIKKYYCQEKQIDYKDLPKKGHFRTKVYVKDCIADYVEFKTNELQSFLKKIRKLSIGMKDDFKEELHFYNNVYSFMKGGLHTENKPEIFEADDEYEIIDWDVSSYYPAIIIKNGRFPKHLGSEFLMGYEQMFNKRLELKPLAKTDKKIKGIVGALKLAVNSVFGKSSDMQSWIYDRQLTMFTTITGELSLMMLIEAYELRGIHVISANTDGVTVRIKKSLISTMHGINEWWMTVTGYELERTDYQKIVFSTVNDYIAIKTDGEIKKKGDFLTDFELYKNKSARIVPLALEQYFLHNIPVEHTISTHSNIYDFCIRQKASKDFHYEGVNNLKNISISEEEMKAAGLYETVDGKWAHIDDLSVKDVINKLKIEKLEKQPRNIYNKLIRYHISITGEKLLKVKNSDSDSTAPELSQVEAGEWMCKVCNYLPKDTPVEGINYQYYIEKAENIIYKIQSGGKKRKIEVSPNQLNLF
jgi:hypothetical protein